ALGGVLARAPSEPAIAWIMSALTVAAGAERDALIGAVGAATTASGVAALAQIAHSYEPSDRAASATMTAAHGGDAVAIATARALLGDSDAQVRAQAAWSLGTIGDVSDLARLSAIVRHSDFDAAVDSAAAIGRICARGARAARAQTAEAALCPLLGDPRAYVRANVLAGLALASARCESGAIERSRLSSDPSEDVRAAAARALDGGPSPEDRRALDRCAADDPSSTVAALCRQRPPPPTKTSGVLFYVVPAESSVPRPASPYAMRLADGMIHAGTTDRRGAVLDPVAPAGDVTLR
ncbi:MAG: HEAT repeat domain-containing protein, partial [Polyangiaceae bacterium]